MKSSRQSRTNGRFPGAWKYRRGVRVGRVRVTVGVVALAWSALGAIAAAQTTNPPTTGPTSTDPPSSTTSTTTSTTGPSTTTTTTSTTTTTTLPPVSATPVHPGDNVQPPTPAQDAAARAAFSMLTESQRLLLRRLQSSRDALAVERIRAVALGAQAATARTRWAAAETAVVVADRDVEGAGRELDGLHAAVRALASSMYQHMHSEVVLEAVNTADRAELNRVRTYAAAPQAVLDGLATRAGAKKRELASARERAVQARSVVQTTLDTMEAAVAKERDALAAAEAASAAAVQAVTDALGSSVSLLAQVAAPQFGADATTATLAVVQAGAGDPTTLYGSFRMPIPGAPLGSPYGLRVDPLTGSIGNHPGIDFEAAAGTEVHASASGTVVVAGDCGGYGNCVVIDHGHSLATVSAHLSQTLVPIGQTVSEGQVVGLVGSTGRSTGPHLHFEVRLHGAPIDPITSLAS